MKFDLDAIGLVLFVLSVVVGLLLVPDLSPGLAAEPAFGAIVGGAIALAAIVLLRARGGRGSTHERRILGAFLFLMPTVYVTSALRGGASASWLAVELTGQLVFGALAI